MAAETITIDTETSAGDMAALLAGINARSKKLGKTTEDSSVAAAITILRSLKASTKKAPLKVNDMMMTVSTTGLYGGLYREGGRLKVCARIGSHNGARSPIRPAIGFSPGSRSVFHSQVYAVRSTNPNAKYTKSVNAPTTCWYVLAENEGQARRWAEGTIKGSWPRGIINILKKESGMAKAALAMAQAKASTMSRVVSKEEFSGSGTMSGRASAIAYDAGKISVATGGFDGGSCNVSFFDNLRYSDPAAGGNEAIIAAMNKAANSMLGAYGSAEIKAALEDMKVKNPEAKFVDIFRSKFSA